MPDNSTFEIKNELECQGAAINFERIKGWSKNTERRISELENKINWLPGKWEFRLMVGLVIILVASINPVIAKALIKFL